jgi:hypothetical protein
MKKTLFTLSILAMLATASCKKETKVEDAKADTLSVVKDSVALEIKDAPIDPDPNDTIPAGQYGINSSNIETANLVRLTLQDIYKDDLSKKLIDETRKKFVFFEYDLNGDSKKEIFVGLIGSYFCGSGGCTQYILDHQGKVITRFTVSDYPVIIDSKATNNWKNLIILSGGKNRLVQFDGKSYPSNPSVQPQYKMTPGDELTRALHFVKEPYPWFVF